jgi:hypothetical protein
MSQKGFTCPLTGGHVHHTRECVACPSPCMELPMLFTLGETREPKPDVYYATAMANPSKLTALSLMNDYYPYPQDLVWMNFGSAFHIIIERSRESMAACNRLDKDFIFEERFSHTLEVAGRKVELHGRADQYQISTRTLTDYKAGGAYAFKKLREGDWSSGYDIQLNIYRKFLYPHAEKLQLAFMLRDYTGRMESDGLQPTLRISAPFIEDSLIDELIVKKIQQIQHTLEHPDEAIPCTDAERWWNGKAYTRCEKYCNAAPFCDQAARMRRTK